MNEIASRTVSASSICTSKRCARASAPEVLVKGVIEALAQRFEVQIEEAETVREAISFKLPRVLAD